MITTGRDFVSQRLGKAMGAKGPGAALQLAGDLVPVIQVHDLELGFEPPFVPFTVAFEVAAVAAQFSYAYIGLLASAGVQARAIVDLVMVIETNPWIRLTMRSGNIGLATSQIVPAYDTSRAPDFDVTAGPNFFDTRVGTMEAQLGASATDFTNANWRLFPGGNNSAQWTQVPTQIIMRQGQCALFSTVNVNETLRLFCRGRFYEQ